MNSTEVPSSPPEYYVHVTDSHVACYVDQEIARINFEQFLKEMQFVQPDAIFHTGDLIDNLDKGQTKGIEFPNEPEWKPYADIGNKYGADSGVPYPITPDNFIEILGNHDYWETLKKTWTESNRPDRYFLKKPEEGPKRVSSFRFGETKFIAYLPLEPPVAHGYLQYWISPKEEDCPLIQTELATNYTPHNVLLSHWSTMTLFPETKCLQKFLDQNFIAFLNGHSHPKKHDIWHHQEAVEFTGTALTERPLYAIFSIDGGRLSYWPMTLFTNSTAVPTYPVPDNVTWDVYTENIFNVRLLSFSSSTNRAFNVTVDDFCAAQMHFERFIDERPAALYTFPCAVPNGRYTMKITGEADYSYAFSIGQETEEFEEIQSDIFKPEPIRAIYICFVVYFVIEFIWVIVGVVFRQCEPLHILFKASDLYKFYGWLFPKRKEDPSECSSVPMFALLFPSAILLSPFILGFRCGRSANLAFSVLWIIVALFAILLPNCVFKIEDKWAEIWMGGFYVSSQPQDSPGYVWDFSAYMYKGLTFATYPPLLIFVVVALLGNLSWVVIGNIGLILLTGSITMVFGWKYLVATAFEHNDQDFWLAFEFIPDLLFILLSILILACCCKGFRPRKKELAPSEGITP
jgi:hypothetical protein